MKLPFARSVETLPTHVVFPEDYQASVRQIRRDFVIAAVSLSLLIFGMAVYYV